MSDPTSSATAAAAPTLRRGNYFGLGTYLGLAGALLAMIALFSALSSHFLSYGTFLAIANQIPDLVVLAVGMTFILIVGGIDLSVGSVLALAASAVSLATLGWGWGVLPAAMLGMACATWPAASPVRSRWPGGFPRSSCPSGCWRWPVGWPTR